MSEGKSTENTDLSKSVWNSDGKTTHEGYDSKHGKYNPAKIPDGTATAPTTHDPKPFGSMK